MKNDEFKTGWTLFKLTQIRIHTFSHESVFYVSIIMASVLVLLFNYMVCFLAPTYMYICMTNGIGKERPSVVIQVVFQVVIRVMTSLPQGLHFAATRSSLRCHKDFTSLPQEVHFAATRSSLRCHKDFTSLPLGLDYAATRSSLRCHKEFTSLPQGVHFSVTRTSLRCHYDFTSLPLGLHFIATRT